ncbi:hypothetical protein C5167_014447 [Papaver somniferum]|uniref:Uncharacterized protein n=1 Tax=Papaver somniferum TaxID=3469 RepID=A0A4Y7J6B1_PAPSO|nr:hypothetical protein C5167_014447 [Papaver somniferum]
MELAQVKGSSKEKEIRLVDADEMQEVEEDDIEGDYMEEMEDFERTETQMQAESDMNGFLMMVVIWELDDCLDEPILVVSSSGQLTYR